MKRLQIPQKLVYEKFYVHEIAAVNLSKIYFMKNAKKTYKPNNRNLIAIEIVASLTLIRLGFLRVVFSGGRGSIWPSFRISRETYLISISLYTIVKQSIWSMLKVKKFWHHLLYANVICLFVTRWCQKIQKIDENWWKLANFDREFLHIFWTTWGKSMKFSGKMYLKIILKVTKTKVLPSL